MWRFKFLLIGMTFSVALGAILFFVGRYVLEEIKQEVRENAVAAVDDYFVDQPLPSLTEERVVISERDLTSELRDAEQDSDIFNEDGLSVVFEPGLIRILDGNGSNRASVTPSVVNGRIELGKPSGVASLIPFDLAETVIDRIEANLATYFDTNNAIPTSIEITERQMIIEVKPKPGMTFGTPVATPRAGARTPTPRSGARTATTRAVSTSTAVPTDTPVARVTAVGTIPTVSTPTSRSAAPTGTATQRSLLGRPLTPTPTPAT